ncbi:MAG: succinyl-CoA---D-citramalate CoA-transferase [Actinomycetota bacterium]|jgi:formyl-CoA transferase|nr:succinyl-CoA---D-citramalate CoA-transferase [Actinomycetota bacterium]
MTTDLPLAGVRVLEPAVLLAGPFATSIFADFGAEVIKVEQPGGGDGMRFLGPTGGASSALWWKSVGRNKKSITLNLRVEEGQRIFRELAKTADVVLESFRPGTMDKWNIGWSVLSQDNPKLIMASQTGFGQNGPYAQRPAYGAMFEAYGGMVDAVSFEDAPPTHTGMTDHIAGLTIAYAVMFALYHRDVHGGPGQHIDSSATEAVLRIIGDNRVPQITQGIPMPPKKSMANPYGSLLSDLRVMGVFQCLDGKWILLHPGTSGTTIWVNLMRLIGREDFLDEDSYEAGSPKRTARRVEIIETLKEWFGSRLRDEVVKLADADAITAGPIYNIEDALEDPHFQARGVFVTVDDDEVGNVTMVGPVPRFSATPGRTTTTGPALGAHTEEVLGSIGITPTDIETLRANGVV